VVFGRPAPFVPRIMAPVSVPPPETVSVPVAEMTAPLTAPPARTFSVPLAATVALLVIQPETSAMPPLEMVRSCAVAPDDMFRTPSRLRLGTLMFAIAA